MKRFVSVLMLVNSVVLIWAAGDLDLSEYAVQLEQQEVEMPKCLQGKEYMTVRTAEDVSLGTVLNDARAQADVEPTFSLSQEADKYGYYTPKREVSWIPVPIIAAGFIAKGQKKHFREARQNLQPEFHHRFDDQLQFGGIALATGLKIAGVEGRSSWGRYLASTAMSYAAMALIVNVVKNSAHEMRPDGSTANSFPSGHTATAFVGATILHKEYGLTCSPWYSVAGYAMATTTGVMRSLNNRHWISDILVGAGIGILSTDLGYMLGDVMFKKKGIVRQELEGRNDLRANPSFFNISMGASFINDVPFNLKQLDDNCNLTDNDAVEGATLRVGTATHVQAEVGYFPFKSFPYIGIGGRMRIATAPVRANGMAVYGLDGAVRNDKWADITDQMAIFSEDLGIYLNLPLSKRFALGGHLMAGSQQHSDVRLYSSIVDYDLKDELKLANPDWTDDQAEDEATYRGDQIRILKDNNFKWGAGVSLTYAYRNGIAWKVYCDYDYADTDFNGMYYTDKAGEVLPEDMGERTQNFSFKKGLNHLSIGASMSIMF